MLLEGATNHFGKVLLACATNMENHIISEHLHRFCMLSYYRFQVKSFKTPFFLILKIAINPKYAQMHGTLDAPAPFSTIPSRYLYMLFLHPFSYILFSITKHLEEDKASNIISSKSTRCQIKLGLAATILGPSMFARISLLQGNLKISHGKQRVPRTSDMDLLTENFWKTKRGGQTSCPRNLGIYLLA